MQNKNQEKVAVIILNYFGLEDTVNAIESVRRELNAFFYLVDNSASDKEKSSLKEAFSGDKNVTLLFPDKNMGFAAGVNYGIEHAIRNNFKYFIILNNDAVLIKGAGNFIKKAWKENPCSLISPAIKWGGDIVRGSSYHKYSGLLAQKSQKKSFGWISYLTGCALFFDLEFINSTGIFDDDFFMYGEDVEYSYRAAKKGLPLIILRQTLVEHKGSKSSIKASLFYEYHVNRGHFLLIRKIIDINFLLYSSYLTKALVLFMRAFYRSLKFRSVNPLAGWILAPFPLQIRPH